MQSTVRVGMSFLVGLLLFAFAFRVGRSQVSLDSCSTEAIFCLADEDCSVCAGQLQELQDAGTITADTDADCLAFFADVCSAVDETCDVTNEFLVDLAACLAEDQLGCTGFTDTTCAEATAMTPAPSATPAPSTVASVTSAPSGAPTMMARAVTTGAPTMAPTMPPTRTTGAPTMAPTATTGAPTIMPGYTMGPTAAPSVSESMAGPTAAGTDTPAPMGEAVGGSNTGARLSSAATATTTLVGLTLVVGLLVVPSRVL